MINEVETAELHIRRVLAWLEESASIHERLADTINDAKIFSPLSMAAVYRHVAHILKDPRALDPK